MRRIAHSRCDPKVTEALIGIRLTEESAELSRIWSYQSSSGTSSTSLCGALRLISSALMSASWWTNWHWRRVFSESVRLGPMLRTSFSLPPWVVWQSWPGGTLLHPLSLSTGFHFDQTLEWSQSNVFFFCFLKLSWRSHWESRTPLMVHESQVSNQFYAITN